MSILSLSLLVLYLVLDAEADAPMLLLLDDAADAEAAAPLSPGEAKGCREGPGFPDEDGATFCII